jgi:hypothetical protein
MYVEGQMAKIDLDSMSIDELVKLRENVDAKLVEKVAARQLELEAEMKRLSESGKPVKKSPAAPAANKPRKSADKKSEEASEQPEPPVAEAA